MAMTNFILISGPRGHGKDHFAKEVEKHFPPTEVVGRRSLADPIKEIAAKMLGTTVEYIESRKRDTNSGVRDLLIDIGLSGRKYSEGLWVNRLITDAAGVVGATTTIVPDVRFFDEVEHFELTRLMGSLIKVFVYDLEQHDIERDCESEQLSSGMFDYAASVVEARECRVYYDAVTGYTFVDNTGRPDLTSAAKHIAGVSIDRSAIRMKELVKGGWL